MNTDVETYMLLSRMKYHISIRQICKFAHTIRLEKFVELLTLIAVAACGITHDLKVILNKFDSVVREANVPEKLSMIPAITNEVGYCIHASIKELLNYLYRVNLVTCNNRLQIE